MSNLPGIPLPLPPNVVRGSWVDEKGVLSDTAQKTMNSLPQLLGGKVAIHFGDTKKKRLTIKASLFADGTQWKETDTGVTYASVGKNWSYSHGIFVTTSDLLPADLGLNDVGFLVSVTDFNHSLRWNGTNWEFAPGDHGSGYIVAFVNPPVQAGWLLCDGSTGVATLQGDGTIDFSVTLPNTPGSYYRQ